MLLINLAALLVHLGAAVIVTADEAILLPPEGVTIARSGLVAPGTYRVAPRGDEGAVVVVGDDLVVDFQGAVLCGADEKAPPDTFTGRGIVVRGRNVTLKNAVVRGYKVAIYAEAAAGLRLEGCDVSGNYRQRLKSTPEREHLDDWLWGHENDDNQWLCYGAGIYLLNCPRATVTGCRARSGQNGLCLVRCDAATVVENDMSFMSGWGLAMWRSSGCEVVGNRFDFCIRGYSHGVYSRGQDSAGIFVFEQCSDNLFAYNSATHGGDGFFLYAGHETTQKTGTGGCNRNLVYHNDFSHAAANGIEATFSQGNRFIENRLDGCEHGIWAGYSLETVIEKNTMAGCANGISIEHGAENRIRANRIVDTKLGVHLWWDDDKDLLASAFGKAHNGCPSWANEVSQNTFKDVVTAISLADDQDSSVMRNSYENVKTSLLLAGACKGTRTCIGEEGTGTMMVGHGDTPNPVDCGAIPMAPAQDVLRSDPRLAKYGTGPKSLIRDEAHYGRQYIVVDEWGPYDFNGVRVFPTQQTRWMKAAFQLLGPSGEFRVRDIKGNVHVRPMEGDLPSGLGVSALADGLTPFELTIECEGRTLTARGMLLRAAWTVRYYTWTREQDPRESEEHWKAITSAAPVEELNVPAIDFAWNHRAPSAKVPADRFATTASTTMDLPAGTWKIRTVSDDGVRVRVDGREVLKNWTWHAPTEDTAEVTLEAGAHRIEIDHFEIDGYAQLQFFIEP